MGDVTTAHHHAPSVPAPYWPRMNRRGWRLSPFAWIVMIVVPLFWPVLAVLLLATVFMVALQLVLALVGNVLLYAVWLAAALVAAVRG
jgi:hypothetical protein